MKSADHDKIKKEHNNSKVEEEKVVKGPPNRTPV